MMPGGEQLEKKQRRKRRPASKRWQNPSPLDQRTLLTVREGAQYLNCPENTMRMWIWQRRLRVVRFGRSVRLRREDLEQLREKGL